MKMGRHFHSLDNEGVESSTSSGRLFPRSDLRRHAVRAVLGFCAVVGLLGLTGCDSHSTADIGNSKQMIAALELKVPKGTALAAAKTFMEAEKFEVEEMKKARWKGKADLNFLKCTRKDGSPPIFRQWEVAVMHDGKVVTSIDARTALLYP